MSPPGTLPPPQTVEVADGVFAYLQPDGTWWINNTGFVVGEDTIVAVDAAATERRTRDLLAAIGRVSRHPIRTLVNTHHHGDHTNGNCLFDDAVVIGHPSCRDGVLDQPIGGLAPLFGPIDWGELTTRAPTVILDERLSLLTGHHTVELHYIGTPAHTTGDVVAWLPDERVLFVGDLVFNGGTPFVMAGSVNGSLEALQRVREFGAITIVPGHGPLADASTLDVVERYLGFVLDVARDALAEGLTPLEAASSVDLGEFADLHDRERIVGNLHRAMAELTGGERGARIDIAAAFTDMVAYNGGRPLRCLA